MRSTGIGSERGVGAIEAAGDVTVDLGRGDGAG